MIRVRGPTGIQSVGPVPASLCQTGQVARWVGGWMGRYRKLLKEWKVLSLVRRKPHRDITAAVKYPKTYLRQRESRNVLPVFPCAGDREHQWIKEQAG